MELTWRFCGMSLRMRGGKGERGLARTDQVSGGNRVYFDSMAGQDTDTILILGKQ